MSSAVSTHVTVLSAPALPQNSKRGFRPDLESEICTLAAWCQAKQQQRDPLPSPLEDEVDLTDSEDEATAFLAPLSLENSRGIKEAFLDQLAELLCHDKRPWLITSTALMHSEEGVTIVVSRNSNPRGETWSNRDIKMLEYLAQILERISADDGFESDPLPSLQNTLVEYYEERIRHHASRLVSLENGKTGLRFFREIRGSFLDGHLNTADFVKAVEALSYHTGFYAALKAKLTPKALSRVVEELACIQRPIQGADVFAQTAKEYPEFQSVKIILLESIQPRKLKIRQSYKSNSAFEEREQQVNVHAEMILLTYLLRSESDRLKAFPYLGVSKKTCFLCGHILQAIGQFKTRANHGKIYSLWTLPLVVWTSLDTDKTWCMALQRLREVLQDEYSKTKDSPKDLERESEIAAPVSPRYEKRASIFNRVIEDPRLLEREAEWFARLRKREKEHEINKNGGDAQISREGDPSKITKIEDLENSIAKNQASLACAFCKNTGQLTYSCRKCRTAYCGRSCFTSHRHQHKFKCNLGRPIDATDHLMLSCQLKQFPQDEDVLKQYGFMSFTSGRDRSRLFGLYCRLMVECGLDEDELRAAVTQDKLKEMLMRRCSQLGDPRMKSDMHWLQHNASFRANGEGPGFDVALEAARRELLNPEEREVPIMKLQPPLKRDALVFYAQIRHGFRPDVDEDNWIRLGFCTAPDLASEQQLACTYASLVEQCRFDEFWNAMAKSTMMALLGKYGLTGHVIHRRNFTDFMSTVGEKYQSVWQLKRFTRMNNADPFRAVIVDYGFLNCKSARQRMQLKGIYRKFFESGGDEVTLHRACITGELAGFLETTMGSLPISRELLWNPYPEVNHPLNGMVTYNVISCPQSIVHTLEGKRADVIIVGHPDDVDEDVHRAIQDRAAFLGTGLRKRYAESDGTTVMELAMT